MSRRTVPVAPAPQELVSVDSDESDEDGNLNAPVDSTGGARHDVPPIPNLQAHVSNEVELSSERKPQSLMSPTQSRSKQNGVFPPAAFPISVSSSPEQLRKVSAGSLTTSQHLGRATYPDSDFESSDWSEFGKDAATSASSRAFRQRVARELGGNQKLATCVLRIPLLWRTLIIVCIPMIALVILSGVLVAEKVDDTAAAKQTEQELALSRVLLSAVDGLQTERGRTATHLACLSRTDSTSCQSSLDTLIKQRETTDARLADLEEFGRTYKGNQLMGPPYIEASRQTIGITQHRRLVDAMTLDSESAYDWYTTVIQGYLITNAQIFLLIRDGELAALFQGLVQLQDLKEITGVSRALGSALYHSGRHASQDAYNKWVHSILNVPVAEHLLEERTHPTVQSKLSVLKPDDTEFNARVAVLMTYDWLTSKPSSAQDADEWFAMMTHRISQIDRMVASILGELSSSSSADSSQAVASNVGVIIGVALLAVVCGLCTYLLISSVKARTRVLRNEVKKRKEMTKAIARFFPSEFMALLGKKSVTDIKDGMSTKVNVAVMFIDIRNFTEMCEGLSLEEAFELLHNYARTVAPIIKSHHGFIDKMMGDGIMAVFETAADAVHAAINVQYELRCINSSTSCSLDAHERQMIHVGIGIHCGDVVLGMLGDSKRIDGTIVGDVVNTASRLEGLTKVFGANIIVSREVLVACGERNEMSSLATRRLGTVRVKGKTTPVELFDVYQSDSIEMKRFKMDTHEEFEKAGLLYEQGRFEEARECLARIRQRFPALTDNSVLRRETLVDERMRERTGLLEQLGSMRVLVDDYIEKHGPVEVMGPETLGELAAGLGSRAAFVQAAADFDGIDSMTTK